MEALKLFEEPTPEPKKKHWKLERADAIYRIFEEVTGSRMKVPYGVVMGMLTKISECIPTEDNKWTGWGYLNEETGAIEFDIPPMDEFESQYRSFFTNEFAKKANYPLGLFFKQYGTFEQVKEKIPLKVKPQVKQTRVMFYCSDCKKNHYSDELCQ